VLVGFDGATGNANFALAPHRVPRHDTILQHYIIITTTSWRTGPLLYFIPRQPFANCDIRVSDAVAADRNARRNAPRPEYRVRVSTEPNGTTLDWWLGAAVCPARPSLKPPIWCRVHPSLTISNHPRSNRLATTGCTMHRGQCVSKSSLLVTDFCFTNSPFFLIVHRVLSGVCVLWTFFFIFRFQSTIFFYPGKTSTYCCHTLCMYITAYNRTAWFTYYYICIGIG